MKRLTILLAAVVIALVALPSGSTAATGDVGVTGAGEGVFPSGAVLYGVTLHGMQFGKGVIIATNGMATGQFQAYLVGTTALGLTQNINVEGNVAGGSVSSNGTSATVSGIGNVDLGNGQT